jgi:hypothetical protein
MMLKSQRNLLKEHVNTFLGSMLLGSVALWAGTTIWHVATGENPITTAFASMIEERYEDL